jgi:hypothetical protein
MQYDQSLSSRLRRKIREKLRISQTPRTTPYGLGQPLYSDREPANNISNLEHMNLHPELEAQPEKFQHNPLDLESPSIRLIRILPDSQDRHGIQCDIRLASVASEYTCLSYVWGDPSPGEYILLNERRFYVRRNLHNFLKSARSTPYLLGKWIWIDALCIDQKNLDERQHQVQQMGDIFSRAQEVVCWLGMDEDIATLLKIPISPPEERDRYWSQVENRGGFERFVYSPYWYRAWITQEITLGTKVKLMACRSILDLDHLPERPSRFSNNEYNRLTSRTITLRRHYQRIYVPKKTLAELLYLFKFQQCHLTRDRVFSLLALCKEGSNIEVDYETTQEKLTAQILRCCPRTFCLCSFQILADAFRITSKLSMEKTMLTKLEGYGALTLPMIFTREVAQLTRSAWNDSDADYRQDYEDTVPSKILVYMPKDRTPDQLRIEVTINLNGLCPSYRSVVKIAMEVGEGVSFHRYYDKWSSVQHKDGMEISIIPGARHCSIRLSLAFWLYCARMARRQDPVQEDGTTLNDCCPRIFGTNVPSAQDIDAPALRLSERSENYGIKLKYPWIPDDFTRFVQNIKAEWEDTATSDVGT